MFVRHVDCVVLQYQAQAQCATPVINIYIIQARAASVLLTVSVSRSLVDPADCFIYNDNYYFYLQKRKITNYGVKHIANS